ncbi:hypothetical protein [Methylomagnum ishizawai]|uniref:hypothetical protein n=1 Tax=Methylomagnum ishizawai TaxID=1760988 RepID=UPI001C33FBD6|nr:hypothetical protein [Methylomagnum ishizawai]BBL77461.1 hypothetical protein MishRS11D_45590 [Methylomagnum ishizawai]
MTHLYTKPRPGALPTTNAERIRNHRQRRKEAGQECLHLWLDQETIIGLQPYLRQHEILVHGIARILKQLTEPQPPTRPRP